MAKVMIVDDSLFMQKHITRLLTQNGYDTIVAEDGEQAVCYYRQDRPDIVVMDIMMPHKDGLQALSEIRQIDPQARVIMLTALDQEIAATRAIHLGARDFLVKPASPERLLNALRRTLHASVCA
ncbi:MAG TPA: response regulator [Chloroflexi bacterium]|nr:response regulator [Chloroflexota bacterium]